MLMVTILMHTATGLEPFSAWNVFILENEVR
jgi:hypothetical protein